MQEKDKDGRALPSSRVPCLTTKTDELSTSFQEDLAAWTRLSATSIEKSERMFSRLVVMMAAFAASSLVGASPDMVMVGVAAPVPNGFGVDDRDEGTSPLTRALGTALLCVCPEKLGKILTGIITTFLNEDKKSFLSAWRLTFDIRKLSVEAACADNAVSHFSTSASALVRKNDNSSARYVSR